MSSGPVKTDADRLVDAQNIIRRKNTEITHLSNAVRNLHRDNDTAEAIRKEIFGLAAYTPSPPAWIAGKGGRSGFRGCPCTIWSDWHYGEVVDADQIGGVNKFNPAIARKRAQRLVETTIDLAFNHMGRADTIYPGIVVMLGGDMVGGDIHEELHITNARTTHQCVNDLTDLLAGCIDQMATKFGKVFVPAVVGNHGRSTKKRPNKNMVYTNYDWSIYCNLERYFRGNKHIQFLIPSNADANFNVFGHRYLLTHGDTLGVKGGDGIIGALGPIKRGSIKVHHSEAQIGRDFDTIVMGHWHQYLPLPGIIVNNALKGFDEYAHLTLRADFSRASQALWFTHPEHGITAHWQIYLQGREKFSKSEPWVSWQK